MISFQVKDMHCGHCVRSITEAVQGLDPAARLKIDLDQHLVQVDAAADAAQLAAAIRQAGYTPVPIPTSAALAAAGPAPARKGCCCG